MQFQAQYVSIDKHLGASHLALLLATGGFSGDRRFSPHKRSGFAPMDMRSELADDVEKSIARAHNPDLSHKERRQVQAHLAFILTKLKEPNAFIEPVKHALSQMASHRKWHEKPLGILLITVVGTVIAAGVIFKFGWNK